MAAPTVVNVGAAASGIAAITPAFPAGITDGDILVTIAESVGGENYTLPGGWLHVTGSPVVQSTNTQLTVIWHRYTTGDTAPSLGDPGNHAIGRMIALRGCLVNVDPYAVVATAVESVADTSAAWPGLTDTGGSECLILECIATGRDAAVTTNLGALTNANYTNIVEQMDNWISSGTGGGIGMVSAVMTNQGATGSSTATMGSTDTKAMMTISFPPEPFYDPMLLWRRPRIYIVG
jgi:hypothetical protein